MYIEPQVNIRLLSNVPLDNTYDHTILFQSAGAQTAYFQSKTKYSFTNQTYQRVRRGYARVQQTADNLYDCNYMMFQNTGFGNKWFYAFVKSVEYVNNVTSEIEFEIDVMQTWHFDYALDICYVERQHSRTDAIGDHIEAEPLDLGEYVYNGWENITEFSEDYLYIVGVAEVDTPTPTPTPDPEDPDPDPDPDPEPTPVWSEGKLYDGLYGGLTYYYYHGSEINQLNALIASKIQTPDAIQGIWVAPNTFSSQQPSDHKVPQSAEASLLSFNRPNAITTSDSLDGYTPKNNKLYTYPYNFYHVDNNSGKGLDLRYEFCNGLRPNFSIYGTLSQPVKVILRPFEYKLRGSGTAYSREDYTQNLTLENFPQCSWNMDAYWAWVAQNSVPEMMKLAGEMTSLHTQFLKNVLGFGSSDGGGIGAVINAKIDHYKASIASDICKGNIACGNVNVGAMMQDFFGTRVSLNRNDARQVDDFFSRFGYAVGRLQLPDRNARPEWTYVKTGGCTVSGSVPCDDMKKICSIYDNGITWWNNPAHIGQYNLSNAPYS